MVSFGKEEAKRLIGMVSMGAALANIANGSLVGLLVRNAPGGSFAIVPLQCALLLLQLLPNAAARSYVPQRKTEAAQASKLAPDQRVHAPSSDTGSSGAWYTSPQTQMMAAWTFGIVGVFSCIEFQYSAVLGVQLDADEMAEVTATLASLAGVGQIFANLLLTPFLLQKAGIAVALLVTPAAYALGQGLILSSQSVASVFAARSLDFILRCDALANSIAARTSAPLPTTLRPDDASCDGRHAQDLVQREQLERRRVLQLRPRVIRDQVLHNDNHWQWPEEYHAAPAPEGPGPQSLSPEASVQMYMMPRWLPSVRQRGKKAEPGTDARRAVRHLMRSAASLESVAFIDLSGSRSCACCRSTWIACPVPTTERRHTRSPFRPWARADVRVPQCSR